MSQPSNLSTPADESSTHDQLQLEREKLALERTKAWLTAAAIILPLVASLGTFVITRQQSLEQARIDLQFKSFERGVESKIEFLKLITQKPELRDEAIRNWQQVFPTDEWLKKVTSSTTTK